MVTFRCLCNLCIVPDVLLCVAVVFVRPDHHIGLGRIRSRQHHHPDGRGAVDLPDRHCRDCRRKCSSSIVKNPEERLSNTRVCSLLSVRQVLKEVKVLVWIFVMQNLPEIAFFVYLMYKVRPFFLSGFLNIRLA